MMIDWQNNKNQILINPKLPSWKHQLIESNQAEILKRNNNMIWLLTSGSSSEMGELKLVGLKKKSFLISAEAVNTHIQATGNDIWLKVLPSFHVGGLSILYRSKLSGAKVYEELNFKWSVPSFKDLLIKSKATLVSVVPTQVYDIVQAKETPTEDLRIMFVGGGALEQELYELAIELKWPIILTYGMTEACSQIATSSINDIYLKTKPIASFLKHIKGRTNSEGELIIHSKALVDEYAYIDQKGLRFENPKVNGWFNTDDLATIDKNQLTVFGRRSQQVKVLGELVNTSQLEDQLKKLTKLNDIVVISNSHERRGNELCLISKIEDINEISQFLPEFNKSVAPYEKIKKTYFLKKIPKSELGKPLYKKIIESLFY